MDQFDKFYNKTLRFLSYRPRSEMEIEKYLEKNKADPQTIAKIILTLKKHKFLDDEAFASMWIESRIRSKQKSKKVILIELKQKGISKEIMEKILSSTDINDEELAKNIFEKKLKTYGNIDSDKAKQRLFGQLARRGFSYDIINKLINSKFE